MGVDQRYRIGWDVFFFLDASHPVVMLGFRRTPFQEQQLILVFAGLLVEDSFGSAISQSTFLFSQGVGSLLFGDDPRFRLAIEFSTHLLQLLFEVKGGTCRERFSQKGTW